MNNKCVCCGALIPEGVQYCSNCYVEGEKKMKTKFELGKIVMTNGIARYLAEDVDRFWTLNKCLYRHRCGDWGDLDEEDKQENDFAVDNGRRIFSAYELFGTKIWIITEADRSCTTILLPE